MEGPDTTSYREWDEQTDNAWFRHGRRPGARVLAEVRPLTAEYASRLWRWVFPTEKNVLPLVAKDKKNWLHEVMASEPISFGRPGDPSLQKHLRRLFPWADTDSVFFLVRNGTAYHTPWPVFVEHWQDFLGWYNEGLLFHPTAREVAVFWEVQAMFIGRRSKRHLGR